MNRVIFSRRTIHFSLLCGVLTFAGNATAAEAPVARNGGKPPSAGLRPIGASSMVDSFTATAVSANSQVAQIAYMQGSGFAMPPAGATAPRPAPAVTDGAPPVSGGLEAPPLSGGNVGGATSAAPSTTPLPPGLQPVPSSGAPLTAPPQRALPSYPPASPSDQTPVPQPRLGTNWATADNCNLVSGPSGYRAEFGVCAPAPVVPITYAAPPATYVAPPAVVVPPTVMPGVVPPAYVPAPVGHRPLFTLGQENYNAQLGQGIIGQPTAYVPGQYFRNFIRYLSP